MIIYLVFVVVVTSHIQTLLLDHVLPPPMRSTSRDHLRLLQLLRPLPRLLGTREYYSKVECNHKTKFQIRFITVTYVEFSIGIYELDIQHELKKY